MNNEIQMIAFQLAQEAFDIGEIPVGAVIFNTQTDEILCSAKNEVIRKNDPTGHAEVIAIRAAGQILGMPNLTGYSIYATLEPCIMCAAAISWAQLDRVYFGAYDAKSGAIEHGPKIYDCATCHHKPEVYGGIGEAENKELLQRFFKNLRKK